MNVLRLLILTILLLPISGCMSLPNLWKTSEKEEIKEVVIQQKAVERTKLNIDHPAPLDLRGREIKWMIVTEDNATEVFEKLKTENVDPVFFTLTDDGYKELSLTIAELRNYIALQRSIIVKYKEYYESENKDGTSTNEGPAN